MDRRKLHKANGQTIGKNKQMSKKTRANNRATHQDAQRNLEVEPVVEVVKQSRSDRLKQWLLEKEEKKKQEEQLKKAPFVTTVKRGVFIDKSNYIELNKQKRKKTAIKKVTAVQIPRVPRVDQNAVSTARIDISVGETSAETVATGTNNDIEVIRTLAVPSELNNTSEMQDLVQNSETSHTNNEENHSIRSPTGAVSMLAVPDVRSELNVTFELENSVESNGTTPANNVENQSINTSIGAVAMLAVEGVNPDLNRTFELINSVEAGDQTIKTPKTSLNVSLNYVSPFVTISRGKGSNRKEVKVRESFYKLETSQPHHASPEVRQNREAAEYFRFQVTNETEKLMEMVDYWDKYKNDNDNDHNNVDSVYLDQIDVAIGQTKLLIAKKFKQFLDLIRQCEEASVQPPVLPKDLEGFWSMVFIQVENCSERFRKLAILKENDWIEVDLLPVNVVKQTKKRKAVRKGVSASSGIQKMIEEARLKMKENRISPAKSSSHTYVPQNFSNFSMTLRQTPARLSMSNAAAMTPKSIIKAKTPGGQRNTKNVAFSFVESPSTSNSLNAAVTPKPRAIKRRASTSGIQTQQQNITATANSSFLTPSCRKVTNDKSSSSVRRSHRSLFSAADN